MLDSDTALVIMGGIVLVAVVALAAFGTWLDHKEEMAKLQGKKDTPAN